MTDSPSAKSSRILSSVLTPALRLWLRSQVQQIDKLELQIAGGDRQLLGGYVPQVEVVAENAVYQGLHLTQIRLSGTNIRVNLRQILRGKPLQLLEVVPVVGAAMITEADLNASLRSPLLAQAVSEFLVTLLRSGEADLLDAPADDLSFDRLQIQLGASQLTLSANLVSVSGTPTEIAIRTGLKVADGHQLQLDQPQWLPHAQAKRGLPLRELDGWTIDLGDDVQIEELAIDPEKITCQGRINVIPLPE